MTETAKKKPAKPATKSKTAKTATAKAKKPATAKTTAKPRTAKSATAKSKAAKPASAKPRTARASKPSTAKSRAKSTTSKPRAKSSAAKKTASRGARVNPVAQAANRKSAAARKGAASRKGTNSHGKRRSGGANPPKGGMGRFTALNVCLGIAIALLIALGARQQSAYADFLKMREAVDQQTFYEGTTVEGVDVSRMTLNDAMDYWRERVEPRYANRTVTLDNGMTVTAAELGYESDYASVLSAAWSAGRSGSLEQRYHSVTHRSNNPVAYAITRTDTSAARVNAFVEGVAEKIDRPALDASVSSFNPETYEFEFAEAITGRKVDTDALKRDIVAAVAAGGGNVTMQVAELEPSLTTKDVADNYGLIDYAITNANSSSRARLNNIKLAMSLINGTRIAPGEEFSFNKAVGQRTEARGFRKAPAYSGGEVTEQVGGGICQVSTTLFNAAVKADMEILERHNHSLTVSYVEKGKDATVDWGHQDLRFRNTSPDDVYICCYVTQDNRVRFGIFGRLLPNGEKITLECVTTETTKYETKYEASPLLAPGQTYVLQDGKNGYKAEAYKVRWDAQGNRLSRELLCKSIYKVKNEVIQYGA